MEKGDILSQLKLEMHAYIEAVWWWLEIPQISQPGPPSVERLCGDTDVCAPAVPPNVWEADGVFVREDV